MDVGVAVAGRGAGEVEAIPLQKRPVCPYEQAEYNHALADALDLSISAINENPFAIHIAHNIATLQVMLGRATTEMANATIASQTHAQSDKYTFTHEQVRPHISAISRIGAELRKYIALLAQGVPRDNESKYARNRLAQCRASNPGPHPEQFAYVPPDPETSAQERAQHAKREAQQHIARAVQLANDNNDTEALNLYKKAAHFDKTFTQNWTNSLRRSLKAQQQTAKNIESPP
jgi:hypothetical protein